MNDASTNKDLPCAMPEREARWLRWLLALAAASFVLGIFLPMITISELIFIRSSFSVVSGVVELLRNGQIVLFVVVAGFSVAMPIMKIVVLFKLLSKGSSEGHKTKRYLHLMHEYGRWAMLDVMVVAVLIVTVKLGAIASIKVHLGLFVFGASVLLIMLITNRVVRLTTKHGGCGAAPHRSSTD
jgi:paraquat-inducible protein A